MFDTFPAHDTGAVSSPQSSERAIEKGPPKVTSLQNSCVRLFAIRRIRYEPFQAKYRFGRQDPCLLFRPQPIRGR